jgi:hypothetical protein
MQIIETIHNVLTNEITVIERDLTVDEIATQKKLDKELAEAIAKAEIVAQARAEAETKLTALGLTPEDLRALGL